MSKNISVTSATGGSMAGIIDAIRPHAFQLIAVVYIVVKLHVLLTVLSMIEDDTISKLQTSKEGNEGVAPLK